jgi:hypothetical protein
LHRWWRDSEPAVGDVTPCIEDGRYGAVPLRNAPIAESGAHHRRPRAADGWGRGDVDAAATVSASSVAISVRVVERRLEAPVELGPGLVVRRVSGIGDDGGKFAEVVREPRWVKGAN